MGFNYLFIFPPRYVALYGSKAHHRLSGESVSWCLETSFLRLPSWDRAPSYLLCLSFCLLYFFLPPFKDNGLLFWVPDVLCWRSEVVLWNLLSVQCSFVKFVGEKVISPTYSSAILGPPLPLILICCCPFDPLLTGLPLSFCPFEFCVFLPSDLVLPEGGIHVFPSE